MRTRSSSLWRFFRYATRIRDGSRLPGSGLLLNIAARLQSTELLVWARLLDAWPNLRILRNKVRPS